MSKSVKTAGDPVAASSSVEQHGPGTAAALRQAVADELGCLREAAAEAGAIARVLRYVQSARIVFEEAARDEAIHAALAAACPTWSDPEALSGVEEAMAWLSAELLDRVGRTADIARTIDELQGGQA